jgi:hypothetical protein
MRFDPRFFYSFVGRTRTFWREFEDFAEATEYPFSVVESYLCGRGNPTVRAVRSVVLPERDLMGPWDEHPRGGLHAYLDGELSLEGSISVEEHLEGCAACRLELETLGALHRVLRSEKGIKGVEARSLRHSPRRGNSWR